VIISRNKKKCLVVYANYTSLISYYDDWLDAFCLSDLIDEEIVNICEGDYSSIKKKILNAENIVLLHSVNADTLRYIEPYKEILLDRRGKLFSFVGNELNLPSSPLREKIDFLKYISVDVIITQLLLEAGCWLYSECSTAKVISLPHALDLNHFNNDISNNKREIDIGTINSKYNVYVGDNERNNLLDFMSKLANKKLKVDIITSKRLNRDEWASYLNNCKLTLGAEAGSWYLDKDDSLVNEMREFLDKNSKSKYFVKSDSAIRKFAKYLPDNVRALLWRMAGDHVADENNLNTDEEFYEVYENVIKFKEKSPVYTKCISSRHFDAIGTGTCQIMLAGRYNDILIGDKHYIELKKDFSNIDEVLERGLDDDYRLEIISCAYEHIISHHTYPHRIDELYACLD
jgi:spore maturation protein CgeB